MILDFRNNVDDHLELIQKLRIKKNYGHHLVRDRHFAFDVPNDEYSIQDIIDLHLQGIEVENIVAYVLVTEANADLEIPYELPMSLSHDELGNPKRATWREFILRSRLDGLEHICHLSTTLTVDDLIVVQNTLNVTQMNQAEYNAYTHNTQWREFEVGEEIEFFTIERIDKEWRKYFDDFTQARDKIKSMVPYSMEEAKIAAKWRAVTSTEMDASIGRDSVLATEGWFAKQTRAANDRRIGICQYLLKTNIDGAQLPEIITELNAANLVEKYTARFVWGKGVRNHDGHEDPEGIIDYIMGTAGTSFANKGLINKTLTMTGGLTKEQLCHVLVNVIKTGKTS